MDDTGQYPPFAALFSFGLMVNNRKAMMHPTGDLERLLRRLFTNVEVQTFNEECILIASGRKGPDA